jgi:hypothetical protein
MAAKFQNGEFSQELLIIASQYDRIAQQVDSLEREKSN